MPTYDYQCDACSHSFQEEQSIKDEPIRKCPQCGEERVRRMISGGTNFLLQGGGWYKDGYSK